MNLLMRLLREPLLHFLAIGGLIFLFYAVVDDTHERPGDVIVIGPERISQLAAGFNSVWKRMPTDDELNSLIDGSAPRFSPTGHIVFVSEQEESACQPL